ncbi:MFS transporter [Streptomyces sp. ISL-94]|uniref:MFS transporter n=1 Tax=Streptomyces sp. ISL-94 TaxID=2819190 RepID=UPI001BE6EDB6|nr:MFS transporter [Streptomyces sp. ISL-94]MBT2478107.1 MFS transporter [Streptomyces sp. ISL-94]
MSAPLLTDQAGPPTKSLARPWAGLLVLATTIFVVVTTELLPVGLLTPISDDLGVARSRVGLLVTVYAFTVGLTAAPLTHWTAAWPRKRLYMTVSAAFSLGTVLSAAAESYPMLAIGRFLCGMAHGVFWSIVAGYAAALAKPGRSSRTTAIVFAGNSAALVLGVPLGTVLGNVVGWRGAFCAAAALGLGALAAAQRLLPDIPNRSAPPQSAGLGGALRLPGLRSMVTATALLVLGHFTVYTYVTPLLHDAAAFSEAATSMLLALYGLAGFLGTWLGGVLGDRRPHTVLLGTIALMAGSLVLLGASVRLQPLAVVAVALWGVAFAALPVTLQSSVLRLGATAPDAASAWYVSAFNLGIGGGALTGGLLSSSPVAMLPWTALIPLVPAFVFAWSTRAAFPHPPSR